MYVWTTSNWALLSGEPPTVRGYCAVEPVNDTALAKEIVGIRLLAKGVQAFYYYEKA